METSIYHTHIQIIIIFWHVLTRLKVSLNSWRRPWIIEKSTNFSYQVMRKLCSSVGSGNLFWKLWFDAVVWKDWTGNPESAASPGVLRATWGTCRHFTMRKLCIYCSTQCTVAERLDIFEVAVLKQMSHLWNWKVV